MFALRNSSISIAAAIERFGGPPPRNGRIPRFWLGSTDPNVAIDEETDTYFDHVAREGGGILKLGSIALGLTEAEVAQFLDGSNSHHGPIPIKAGTPKKLYTAAEARRWKERDGWHLIEVRNRGAGVRAVRWEHGTRTQKKGKPEKEYTWEHERGGEWFLGDGGKPKDLYVNRVLADAETIDGVIVAVEGPRKADALGGLGTPAISTRDATVENVSVLYGMAVCIWPDHDKSGRQQAEKFAALAIEHGHARSVSIVPQAALAAAGIPESGDIEDMVALGWEREQVFELCATAEAFQPPKPEPTLLRSISAAPSIFTFAQQHIEWAIEGFIAMSAVTMIAADAGMLKTTLMTSSGRAIADGDEFCGLKTVRRPVGLLDKENSLPVVRERFDRLGIRDGDGLFVVGQWLGDVPAAGSPMVMDWVASCNPKPVIVVDSFIANHEGSENDAADVRAGMKQYRNLADMGAAVVILHHSGKAENAQKYRGSSDIKAAVDVAYTIEGIGDPTRLSGIKLAAIKSRFATLPLIRLGFDGSRFYGDSVDAAPSKTNTERLRDLLIECPNVKAADFYAAASERGLGRDRARVFLANGLRDGMIRLSHGPNNAKFHTWKGGAE